MVNYETRDWHDVQDRIKHAVEVLLLKEPETECIYLFGSYLKGYWADSNTPKGLASLRKSLNKKGVSDIDFMVTGIGRVKKDFNIIHEEIKYKIDYVTLQGNEQKLLVWQKGKVGILGI